MNVVKLKDVVKYRKHFIEIDDNKLYKRCRVQLHRRGIKLRDEVFGSAIKTKKQRLCKENDFVVAEMDAKLGGYGIIPKELEGAIVSSHYYLYEIDNDKLSYAFLDAIIDSGMLQNQIKAVGSTNYSRVSAKEVLEYEIPCPSLEIQHAIVSLYDAAKNNLSILKSELTHQQILVKKLRQQILQEAIEGKLTADWRKQNPNVEPASELLKRIAAEKAQLIKDKKIKKQKPLPPITDEGKPFDLPQGWEWCRMGNGGMVSRGKNPKYDKASNIKILNQKCVRWFYIETRYCRTVSASWSESVSTEALTSLRDILVNSTGDGTIGRAAVVDAKAASLLFDSHVLRFQAMISPQYTVAIINSQFGQLQIENSKGAKSTKQTELGVNKLMNFLIPLPSLKEQQAIVIKVEKLLALCDQLETQITQNQTHAEQLMQAVLKEAFSADSKAKIPPATARSY